MPSPSPGLSLTAISAPLPLRVEGLAGLDLLALGVEDPQRAEARLDGLVEAERDLGGRLVELGPALGHGRLQRRVGERGGREQREREDERGERRDGAPHHASTTSFLGRRRVVVGALIIGVRRRRMTKTASESTISSAAKAKIAASGRPPSSSGTHVSVPAIAPLLAGDLDRHGPVVDLGLDVLVLEVGRVALAHPVRAVVVPLEARALGELLPLRLGAEVRRARTSRPGGPR